jgi:cation diffusion facilitator family transporter
MSKILGQEEKQWAANSSAIAAVGLTLFKLVIGFLTGSLGILAEAAHSGLDLVAAIMTAAAIRFSDKPADENHLYGHGKIENLSALVETLLLLLTCVWIVKSAVGRLQSGKIDIEVSLWSFVVMLTSVGVDVSRSRTLSRAAKQFHSQALEADALHFSTDVWSSAVVILGLLAVKVGERRPPLHWLVYADAVAAIVVAVIVVVISIRLGRRTLAGLLDEAPTGLKEHISEAVSAVPGVRGCRNVRARHSGPSLFIDLVILIDGSQSFEQAHDLTHRVERAIQAIHPEADVTVHPEPL